jgi:hypothetical protein
VNNPLEIRENGVHALDFDLHECLIISRVSVALFPRFAQNLMHAHCLFFVSIVKPHEARYMTPNKGA